MNGAEFFVIDEDGNQLCDEVCGCLNGFNTFKQAEEVCRKVSRKNEGRYSIGVAISTVIYEKGKEIEW